MSRKPKVHSTLMSEKEFAQKIEDLLKKAQRYRDRLAAGYRYKEVWVSGTDVKAHRRRGHWMSVSFKPARASPKKKKAQ